MTVDPKIGFWRSVIYVVVQALLGIAGWGDVMDVKTAGVISMVLSTIAGAVNAVLHGISAPTPGPITKAMQSVSES